MATAITMNLNGNGHNNESKWQWQQHQQRWNCSSNSIKNDQLSHAINLPFELFFTSQGGPLESRSEIA